MPGIHNGIGTTFRSSAFGGGTPPVNLNFVSTWDTTKAGSASNTVVLPLLSGGTYSGIIYWGDGNSDDLSYANRTHVYASSGIYTITISGTIGGFQFNNVGDKAKITDISNWGTLDITTDRSFYNCTNLDVSATDAPIISTTNLSICFRGCTSLTTPDFSNWDVSGVQIFSSMFQQCSNFNGNVSTWDVSSGSNFSAMFVGCNVFNSDITAWNLASATNVGGVAATTGMFESCFVFNQDISNWVFPNLTSLNRILFKARAFNQPIQNWNYSNITQMFAMLYECNAFDQDLGSIDIDQVTQMSSFMTNATGLSTANYDALLIGWAAQIPLSYTGTLNMGGSKYTAGGAAEAARTALISEIGAITDGGPA
jgi:surface protein